MIGLVWIKKQGCPCSLVHKLFNSQNYFPEPEPPVPLDEELSLVPVAPVPAPEPPVDEPLVAEPRPPTPVPDPPPLVLPFNEPPGLGVPLLVRPGSLVPAVPGALPV